MQDFIHIHVHTQYSILDGQASVKKLVDKAIANGMKGIAITDHGNMLGIKEFTNYVNKKNGAVKDNTKKIEAKIADIESGKEVVPDKEAALAEARQELTSVHNSRGWKAGRALVAPFYWLRPH